MKPSICGWKTGGPFLILAICKSKVNNLVEFSLQRCHSLHTWVSIMSYTKTQKPQKQAFPWFWHDLDASVMSTLCQDTGQHASIFSWCQNLFNNRKLRHDSFIGSTLPDYPNCLENSDPDNMIFCLFVCLFMGVCLNVYMCITSVCGAYRSQRWYQIPWVRVPGSCELPCGSREYNPGPLEEGLLTTECS